MINCFQSCFNFPLKDNVRRYTEAATESAPAPAFEDMLRAANLDLSNAERSEQGVGQGEEEEVEEEDAVGEVAEEEEEAGEEEEQEEQDGVEEGGGDEDEEEQYDDDWEDEDDEEEMEKEEEGEAEAVAAAEEEEEEAAAAAAAAALYQSQRLEHMAEMAENIFQLDFQLAVNHYEEEKHAAALIQVSTTGASTCPHLSST
jgi:hypothetical protein